MIPTLFSNLRRALVPLMAEETYIAMDDVAQLVERRAKLSMSIGRQGGGRGGGGKKESDVASLTEDTYEEDGSTVKRGLLDMAKDDVGHGESTNSSSTKKKRVDDDSCTSGYCVPCYELA